MRNRMKWSAVGLVAVAGVSVSTGTADATPSCPEGNFCVWTQPDFRGQRFAFAQDDEHDLSADGFSVHTPDLDDVFLALTGHPSEKAAV
ncbi:peptidase inhibitor family I36 protein [Kibdelosporangium lantanae]|uniref:Peptidase inhibitor family I36 protein n=1 Tax=Kibdelosporangium lantanae TaxID=1497396 RepID=A0ABW3MJF5_9PSEU